MRQRMNSFLCFLFCAALCGQATQAQGQVAMPRGMPLGPVAPAGPGGIAPLTAPSVQGGIIRQVPSINVNVAPARVPNVSLPRTEPRPAPIVTQPRSEAPPSDPPASTTQVVSSREMERSAPVEKKTVAIQPSSVRPSPKTGGGGGGGEGSGDGDGGDGGDGPGSDGWLDWLTRVPWWVWVVVVVTVLVVLDSRR